MVDYSKWDHIGDSDGEEEEFRQAPIVRHIEDGAKISIGPSGAALVRPSDSKETGASSIIASAQPPSRPGLGLLDEYTVAPTHKWKQDKSEVVILIPADRNVKASDIKVKITGDKELSVVVKGIALLETRMKYKTEINSEDGLDWELVRSSTDCNIKITFKKHQYIPGSCIWWSCVFEGDTEIDVTKIPGRESSGSFAENWRLANEMFRERIAARNTQTDTHIIN
jgi:hypothetical protein